MIFCAILAPMKLSDQVRAFLRDMASKGGHARAAALTPKRRKEIATIAVRAREARKNGGKK